eukprot:CAMPEP_0167753180 /NCGR_PEP_ID=MMETSP0110_2-20121227/7562_1 /TAXON_ID=629695 /ORGANISM="Gymnochlora sp., Strain CCMP2014" /LENGTH=297 /DNA_ID=CAMNT_0007638901 /DNA_START=663 /DNA_END=1556 /DNA_ORIENTATION=-
MRVYVYREGIARFATEKYIPANESNIDNLYSHLTNYSINKYHKDFSHSSDGKKPASKWTLTKLFEYMRAERKADTQALWERVKDIIVKTFISVHPTMKNRYSRLFPRDYAGGLCFELVGFDVMLDSSMNAYVLEVNRNPSLNMDSPLDQALKGGVTADTLRLANPLPYPLSKTKDLNMAVGPRYNQKDEKPVPKTSQKLHNKMYLSWEEIREEERKTSASMKPADYNKWLEKRKADAIKLREEAEDFLAPYTNFERVFPPMRKQSEAESDFKTRQLELKKCLDTAKKLWEDDTKIVI